MNEITTGLFMTVKEVADALAISERQVRQTIAELRNDHAGVFELKNSQGGYMLNGAEVTVIKKQIELNPHIDALAMPKTELEMEIRTLEVILWHRQRIEDVEAQNAKLKIKADVADTITDSEGLILLSDAGKQICGHPIKFIQWAEGSGIVFRRKKGGPLLPYAEYDKKYFRLTSRSVDGQLREQIYLTPPGLTWITGKYNAHHFRLNLQAVSA